MNIQTAHGIGPSKIDIAYEHRGSPGQPALVLIMGIGAQLVHWPEGFVDILVNEGFQVIRFDNRDSGQSTHINSAPPPDLPAALAGDLSSVSYTLSDMATDTVALMDALGIERAHLVGASMGGAIAQTVAIEHPGRVKSLTSMMSTTGAPAVGQVRPSTYKALFSGAPATTREEAIEKAIQAAPFVRSPAYPTPAEEIAERTGLAWDRDHDPVAVARQAVASVASGDRTARLRNLDVPTLVIHGTDDGMCDVSGGRATAAAIPGSELVLIEGMGHDLPRALWGRIAGSIAALVRRAENG